MKTEFNARPFGGEADLTRISDLLSACEIEDRMGVNRTPDELRVQFTAPTLDRASDTRLWEDAQGALAAYGLIELEATRSDKTGDLLEGTLRWRVRPDVREQWLDDAVIRWGEARLAEACAARGLPGRMNSIVRDIDKPRHFMMYWHHYDVLHELLQMDRDLHQPIDEVILPEGYRLRHADPQQDADAWIEMYNESFVDHWGHADLTRAEYFHQRQSDPRYAPERDLIVTAPDGTFAAFCWSLISPDEIHRAGIRQALLHQIGTRRGFRRQGLGHALLLATMRTLRQAGMDSVRLYVYTDNQTNAGHLYESVGFVRSLSFTTYAKAVGQVAPAG